MAWSGLRRATPIHWVGLGPSHALLCRGDDQIGVRPDSDRRAEQAAGNRGFEDHGALENTPGGRLPQRRGNVATVHGGDIARRFQGERVVQECLSHIVGGHFPPEQITAHVGVLD
jgi:hypothetical protein